MAAESTPKAKGNRSSAALWREIAGLLLLATALAILLAVVSFSPADVNSSSTPSNLIGPVGVTIGDALLYLFGVGAFFFDALLWYLGFMLLVGRIVEWKWSEIVRPAAVRALRRDALPPDFLRVQLSWGTCPADSSVRSPVRFSADCLAPWAPPSSA